MRLNRVLRFSIFHLFIALSDTLSFCVTPFVQKLIYDSCMRAHGKCHLTKLPINNPMWFSQRAWIIFSDACRLNKSQIRIKIVVNHGTDIFYISIPPPPTSLTLPSTFQRNYFISQYGFPFCVMRRDSYYYFKNKESERSAVLFYLLFHRLGGKDHTEDCNNKTFILRFILRL